MNFPNTLIFLVLLFISTSLWAQEIEVGQASFYSDQLQGRKTASGELYDKNQFTAAHRLLPFGALVEVTNLANRRAVIVKINDMGPGNLSRIIDVSGIAAVHLDMIQSGTAQVQVRVLSEYPDEAPPGVKPGPSAGQSLQASSSRGANPPPAKDPASPPEFTYEIYLPNIQPGHVDTEAYLKKQQESLVAQAGTRSLTDPSGELPAEGYGLQVGAFSKQVNAIEMTRTLQGAGIQNYLILSPTDNQSMYRVVVGPFSDREEAGSQQKELEKQKVTSHVISLKELK